MTASLRTSLPPKGGHHSLPKHHSLSQKVNPAGTAVLNTRQEFHRSLSPVTLRWAVFYTNVTSDNCPARFQYPLLHIAIHYKPIFYPILSNSNQCYPLLFNTLHHLHTHWDPVSLSNLTRGAFQKLKSSHTEPSPWLLYNLNNCSPKFSEREKWCCSKYFNIIWTHNALRFRAKKPNSQGVENICAFKQIQVQYMVMSQLQETELIKEVSSGLLIHS